MTRILLLATLGMTIAVCACNPMDSTQRISESSPAGRETSPSPSPSPSIDMGYDRFPFDQIAYAASDRNEDLLEMPHQITDSDFVTTENKTNIAWQLAEHRQWIEFSDLFDALSVFSSFEECFDSPIKFVARVNGYEQTDPRQEHDRTKCHSENIPDIDLYRVQFSARLIYDNLQQNLTGQSLMELAERLKSLTKIGTEWSLEFMYSSSHLIDIRYGDNSRVTAKLLARLNKTSDTPCKIEFRNGMLFHQECSLQSAVIKLDEQFAEISRDVFQS